MRFASLIRLTLSSLLILLLIASPAYSATVQNLHGGYPSNWGGGGSINIHGITLISKSGTISSMYIKQSGVSGASKTWTYTVYKNGSSTSMTCAISGGTDTSCNDTTHTFTVAAGDYLHINCAPTSSPNTINVASHLAYVPDTSGDTIMYTNGPAQINGPINLNFNGGGNAGWQDMGENLKVASAGTIDNLRVVLSSTMAAGTSMTYTLYKNTASTSLTCTTSAGSSGCNDTSNSVSVSEGDKISILQSALTGWPPNSNSRRISVNFSPTTSGEWLSNRSLVSTDTDLSTTNTEYLYLEGTGASLSTTSTANSQYALASTAKRMYVYLLTAPGSGKSRSFTLRQNNADTSITCTISDTATSCSSATDVTISAADLLNIKTVPTGTPAASETPGISIAEYIAPTGGAARRRVMVLA